MTKNKVTVVVPTYNVEKYIEKCLKSLINQTFKDLDILVVSDGSSDNSVEIVKNYQKKDSRIKLIEKENGGYGSVLEFSIKNIQTEYFIICDPDDWLIDNCIEKLYNLAKDNNLDITIANKYLAYNDGTIRLDPLKSQFYNLKANIVYDNNIEQFSFLPPSPHAKLYRTNIVRNIKFPHKVSYTDFILYTIALKNSKRVLYTEDPLAYYLLERPGNTRTDRKPKVVKDHLIVWNNTFNQIEKSDIYLVFRLYKEIKYITKVYYKNSNNLFKDELFYDLYNSILVLKQYYNSIKSDFTHSLIEKFELKMIFNSTTSLKFYIKLRKLIKK